MKNIIVAKSAGFCFGVRRSVEIAQKLLEQDGKCCCLGELIHNEDVVAKLVEAGMRIIKTPEECNAGDKVIIRAHGVTKQIYDELEKRGRM